MENRKKLTIEYKNFKKLFPIDTMFDKNYIFHMCEYLKCDFDGLLDCLFNYLEKFNEVCYYVAFEDQGGCMQQYKRNIAFNDHKNYEEIIKKYFAKNNLENFKKGTKNDIIGNCIIWFGKHKVKKFFDLPHDYMDYLNCSYVNNIGEVIDEILPI